jgi:hypothetical protein
VPANIWGHQQIGVAEFDGIVDPAPAAGTDTGAQERGLTMFIACPNLISGNRPLNVSGLAAGDSHGDGRDRIAVGVIDGPNRLLIWKDGQLDEAATPELADAGQSAAGLIWADLDGDGREELFISNQPARMARQGGGHRQGTPAPARLLSCFGERWLDLLARSPTESWRSGCGQTVAALDRMGTGRYGLVLTGTDGPIRLLELDSRGRLRDLAEEAGIALLAEGQSLLTAALFGPMTDLYVGCRAGPNLLFRNQGDGSFLEVQEEYGVADPRVTARGLVAFDADGDGLTDLLVTGADDRPRLFQQRAGGGFRDQANDEVAEALAEPMAAGSVLVADVDNDGWEEIFITGRGEPNRLYGWREDRWQVLDAGDASEPDADSVAALVADLDGDGQLELLIGHGAGVAGGSAASPLSLYLAEPRGHGWLRVRPLTRSGAPARGAVVRLTAGGRTQVRFIDGGSGWRCQQEPVAHFGLGAVTRVDKVEVCWPDGTMASVSRPAICTVLTVPFPPR